MFSCAHFAYLSNTSQDTNADQIFTPKSQRPRRRHWAHGNANIGASRCNRAVRQSTTADGDAVSYGQPIKHGGANANHDRASNSRSSGHHGINRDLAKISNNGAVLNHGIEPVRLFSPAL